MKLKAAKRYNSYTQERLESAETKGSAIILEDSDEYCLQCHTKTAIFTTVNGICQNCQEGIV